MTEELQKRMAELSPAKRALLELRLKESARQTIKPRGNPNSALVSFAQQRLWFLDRLEENRALYNVPRALRLIGRLDVEALKRTLNELVVRHEPFRTHFDLVDGTLHQIIKDKLPIAVTQVDLRNLPTNEREEQARVLTREEAGRPFDLEQGPVIRASLLQLSDQEHILLLTTHHIVSDAWSAGILFREFSDVYNAFASGQPSPLAPLSIQYADFAEWQRTWLQGDVLERQLSYWRNKLEGITGVLELPTDYPRTAEQKSHGAYEFLTLSKALSDELADLSKRDGATLFMTLLAAFQVLLWRYSGQHDIVVGCPIAGRNRDELEDLIGFFINTLVLRTDVSGNPTFRMLLKQVKETALAAYSHQDLPFEKLVEELQPERDLGRNPLFQVMFQFQNASPTGLQMNGLSVSKIETFTETAKFDLMLVVHEQDRALKCVIEYNSGLFAAETIERMLKHFEKLLESIVATPEAEIAKLSLITDAERRQLLVDWNSTQAAFPRDRSIHEIFAKRAADFPDDLAVVFGDESVTYGELDTRVSRLANYLRGRGVGPEVHVAICVERSIDMIVGLLGILEAGGAYVPLEPNSPGERLAFILADCQARLLLTQRALADLFTDVRIDSIYLDDDTAEFMAEGTVSSVVVPTLAENSAHVIYTSGSTGQPKGVVSAHRASVNRFDWMWRTYPFESDEVCCQKTSLSFVDSIWEIFGPLLHGVPLVIIPDEIVKDPRQFVDVLSAKKVTRLVLVPSLLRVILEAGQELPAKLENLRYCICSGETLPIELATRFQHLLPNAKLINLYGSSEVAADVTFCEVRTNGKLATVPIGRPIANTEIYILDSVFEPVPAGVMGEICVGGEGLARGYLNRSELTAEKFVPHPFSRHPGARLFRTGDIGRYLSDGTVEYRGRRDHQVKIRGFRIELGEIEAQLANHPQVDQAVVVAGDDGEGGKHLIAYLSAAGAELTTNELRTYLHRKLPDYMIPSVFVLLDAFPLTASGKINRLALPEPDRAQLGSQLEFVAARTPTEEIVASIWAELLNVTSVGVFDDFFALGGHSLLLVRVASRIRESFQLDLPLRSLFEAPTVAALADQIEAAQRSAEGLEDVPLIVVPRDGSLPLSFAQERVWVFEQLEPDTGAYNIPRVLRIEGPLDTTALERSFEAVVARHEVLRTNFLNLAGRPSPSIAESLELELPVTDLSGLPADQRTAKIRALASQEAQRPFDLSHGPLFRLALLRVDRSEHILLMTMHHIISDAWSIEVLMSELAAGYNAFTMETSPSLPSLPFQYIDFAAWQRKALSGGRLEGQLEYWEGQLAGAPPVINLPTDRPRPPVRSFQGARHSFIVTKDVADNLKTLARSERATFFMALLTAFQSQLSCLGNERDIVVGSPVAGRSRPECEALIGYFVNTLVLRSNFSGDPTFRQSLQRTRVTVLSAFANQDVPFEKLVEKLNPPRTVEYNPLFQVWFVLQQAFVEREDLSDLTVQYLESDSAVTRHDLQLSLWETADCLRGAFTYSTALFDAETIATMAEQLKGLLALVVEQPDIRLSALQAAMKDAARVYKDDIRTELAETSRRKLKTSKRKAVTTTVATSVEESWTQQNR